VSTRRHTCAYVSIRQLRLPLAVTHAAHEYKSTCY
jgi:hypothetical protein